MSHKIYKIETAYSEKIQIPDKKLNSQLIFYVILQKCNSQETSLFYTNKYI